MANTDQCAKYFLYGVHTLIAISGVVLFAIATSRVVVICYEYVDYIPDDYQSIKIAAIVGIPIGFIVNFLAGFGCWTAMTQLKLFHGTTTLVLFLLFIGQIALGSVAIKDVNDEEAFMNNILIKLISIFVQYESDQDMQVSANLLQTRLKCCGFYGPESWLSILGRIPYSCCDLKESKCTVSNSYEKNCSDALFDLYTASNKMIGITSLVSAGLEALSLIISVYLICTWRTRSKMQIRR